MQLAARPPRPSVLSDAILQSRRAISRRRDCDNGIVRPRTQTPDNTVDTDATPHYSSLHSTLYPSFCMFRMYTLRRVAENREEHRSRVTIDSTVRPPAPPLHGPRAVRVFVNPQSVARDGIHPEPFLGAPAIINACFPFDMKGPPETQTCK